MCDGQRTPAFGLTTAMLYKEWKYKPVGQLNFKLLHRPTVTKKELCIYGLNDENNCPYCKEPDSILHTFVECLYTQKFFVKVVDWFNAKFSCAFSPTPHKILFETDPNTSRNNELTLNYCLLFAKYYLYYQKMYYNVLY